MYQSIFGTSNLKKQRTSVPRKIKNISPSGKYTDATSTNNDVKIEKFNTIQSIENNRYNSIEPRMDKTKKLLGQEK